MYAIPICILAIESEEDRIFMTEIYKKYWRLMMKNAWRYVDDPQDAEDIVSSAFVELIKEIDTLRNVPYHKLTGYIVITIRNVSINQWRKKHREETHLEHDEEAMMQVPDFSTETRINADAEIELVQKALQRLPEKYRTVLFLKYYQDRKDTEIAEAIGISESSVRKYVERARKQLKDLLYEGDQL